MGNEEHGELMGGWGKCVAKEGRMGSMRGQGLMVGRMERVRVVGEVGKWIGSYLASCQRGPDQPWDTVRTKDRGMCAGSRMGVDDTVNPRSPHLHCTM
ncbi:hypothetical protein Pcinc_034489 [Petrolisthes cinctipes]|uniref:Uncharacterized protein n=1 Tax=Petrolisthes cinctipes TaxID=88211 RepID=A0AAE1EQ82_PETCI|nr:hypothetical protein Pcinc_034489 [Petrolisthes cinctipes]